MNDFQKYIQGVKVRLGIKSDLKLANLLGLTPRSIYNITKSTGIPSDDTCEKIAKLVGDDPAIILLLAHASKAPASSKKTWEGILKKMANVAMFAGVVMTPFLQKSLSTMYIMLN